MKRKANNKSKAVKSNFLKHEAVIVAGELMTLEGWLDAARECRDKFAGNASAYARASVTESHDFHTIRQYVGVGLKAIKRWGVLTTDVRKNFEYGKDTGYAYTNMDDLRKYFIKLENKGKAESKPKSRKVRTITVTPNKVRSVLAKNGVPKSVIDKVVADLA